MIYLKQSEITTLMIGPFLDSADGVTPLTGLTIIDTDVLLSKNGGTIAEKNSAVVATSDQLGYYSTSIDATDTSEVGNLKLMVSATGALPVWEDYSVLSVEAYDRMFASTTVDTNVISVAGTAQTANDNGADIAAILSDTDELQTNQGNWVAADVSALALEATVVALHDFDPTVDEVITDIASRTASQTDVSALALEATVTALHDFDPTIDEVITDAASRAASQADVSGITDGITVDDIIAGITDGTYDFQEMMRLIVSVVAGKTEGNGTIFRNLDDDKNRLIATLDASGNRLAMTYDGS